MGTHPIFESDFDCLTEKKMGYSVVLIYGGEYSNIEAPLMMEAATLGALEHSVIDNFELKNDTKLTLTYCGEILRHSQKMPRDGATIFASVTHALQGDTIPTQPPTQSINQFDEAFRFLNRHTDHRQRSPIREKVRQIIELQLEKRYASHPALCHADIEGARICSSYDMFVAAALTDKKLAEKHKLLQRLVVEVFKEAKTKLPAMLPPGIGGPIVPFGGGSSSNQPSSQMRSANPANAVKRVDNASNAESSALCRCRWWRRTRANCDAVKFGQCPSGGFISGSGKRNSAIARNGHFGANERSECATNFGRNRRQC